ncbi:hypothetical protein FEE96_14250 [Parasedimentitalea maritima]|uniref:Asparagine synthetase domain-containing protein n=1 Tax=Parasedimentitalea maritima TaxID=2578117 RepID=A0ABY2UT82_9RHOB|nr:hypothetical protein [Zongyanglinia marina]TLP61400.1 hypothetical protein FEE96_14250 [Zongyanglinia marina]
MHPPTGPVFGVSYAETICAARGWSFSEVFRSQFRILPAGAASPQGWSSSQVENWALQHCPSLLRTELLSKDGTVIGLVLGVAITAHGSILEDSFRFEESLSLPDLEVFISGLAGRFVVLLATGTAQRLYFDPVAGMTAVFNPETRCTGSSVPLVINDELLPNQDIDPTVFEFGRDLYMLGETCDQRVTRVMGNHYLDLSTFELTRHWPTADLNFEEFEGSRHIAFRRIYEKLSLNIEALTNRFSCALPITGGLDSRLLLSAARPHLRKIKSYYAHRINWATELDCEIGTMIAREMNLPYQVVSNEAAHFHQDMTEVETRDLRDQIRLRTGFEQDGISDDTVRAVALTPDCDIVLRGNVIELTRANKWPATGWKQTPTAEIGLHRLMNCRVGELLPKIGEDRYNRLLARYEKWMSGLPASTHARLYDLAHVEIFLPSAGSNAFYWPTNAFFLNPFNDRTLIHLTTQMAPRARYRQRLVDALVQWGCPELQDIPFHGDAKANLKTARKSGLAVTLSTWRDALNGRVS